MIFPFRRKKKSAVEQAESLIAAGDITAACTILRDEASVESNALLRELLIGERCNEEAVALAKALLVHDHPEADVSRAVLAHLRGDFASAVRACEAALTRDARLATAHNHLGRSLHNMGRSEEALEAFGHAVRLRTGYVEAWHNLGHALRARGQFAASIEAFERATMLSPGSRQPRLNLGITLFNMEQGDAALACFKALLERDPEDADALVNSGLCLQMLGDFDSARQHYEQAIETAPNTPVAHYYLGVLLNELTDTSGALAALEQALRLDPHDVEAWVELAGVCEQSNLLERATEAIGRAQTLAPQHPGLQLEVARLERRGGDLNAAARRLRALDTQELSPRVAQQYFFELGQVLDRLGEYDDAFDAFSNGNMLAADSPRRRLIDPRAFPEQCERLLEWLEQGTARGQPTPAARSGDQGADLCFLVGFPRSGTTLLDTMLDAHSEVVSIEEKPTLETVIGRISERNGGYPNAVTDLRSADVVALRSLYREVLKRWLPDGSHRLIVDKLPLRSLDVGLIHRLFPEARILFALRHPCDVVLSNFMQDYVPTEAFVHFDTLEASCASYDRVMRVWQASAERLPLRVFTLRYEDLVEAPSEQLDALCGYLEIERQDAMLDVDARMQTRDRVRTNSYQQVAEPIYRRSAGRWQHYRDHLEPCLPLLKPHIEKFGYSLD